MFYIASSRDVLFNILKICNCIRFFIVNQYCSTSILFPTLLIVKLYMNFSAKAKFVVHLYLSCISASDTVALIFRLGSSLVYFENFLQGLNNPCVRVIQTTHFSHWICRTGQGISFWNARDGVLTRSFFSGTVHNWSILSVSNQNWATVHLALRKKRFVMLWMKTAYEPDIFVPGAVSKMPHSVPKYFPEMGLRDKFCHSQLPITSQ